MVNYPPLGIVLPVLTGVVTCVAATTIGLAMQTHGTIVSPPPNGSSGASAGGPTPTRPARTSPPQPTTTPQPQPTPTAPPGVVFHVIDAAQHDVTGPPVIDFLRLKVRPLVWLRQADGITRARGDVSLGADGSVAGLTAAAVGLRLCVSPTDTAGWRLDQPGFEKADGNDVRCGPKLQPGATQAVTLVAT